MRYHIECGRGFYESTPGINGIPCEQELGVLTANDEDRAWTLRRDGGYRRRPDGHYELGQATARSHPQRVGREGITIICPRCQFRNVVRSDIHSGTQAAGARPLTLIQPLTPGPELTITHTDPSLP